MHLSLLRLHWAHLLVGILQMADHEEGSLQDHPDSLQRCTAYGSSCMEQGAVEPSSETSKTSNESNACIMSYLWLFWYMFWTRGGNSPVTPVFGRLTALSNSPGAFFDSGLGKSTTFDMLLVVALELVLLVPLVAVFGLVLSELCWRLQIAEAHWPATNDNCVLWQCKL